MARRRESLFDTLLVLPWWVALALGGIGYVAIAFIPQVIRVDGILSQAARSLHTVAAIWLLLCLAAGAGSAVRCFFIARKFDRQRGLEDIRTLSWRQFESLVGEGFRRRGYRVLENARDGADGGIDLVLRNGADSFLVQCKQWKTSKVGVRPIRELLGVITARGAAGGFFVTSGTYTEAARHFAKQTSIELIDGPALEEIVLDARRPEPFLDPTQGRRQTAVHSVDETEAPLCPRCRGAMVLRTALRGPKAGRDFWGCLQFPLCRGTSDQ
jgi:restriction system protein